MPASFDENMPMVPQPTPYSVPSVAACPQLGTQKPSPDPMRHAIAPRGTISVPLIVAKTGAIAGYTLVDEADAEDIMRFTWRMTKRAHTQYARRGWSEGGRGVSRTLHQFLLPTDLEVDHINLDGLDNRRSNLRVVSTTQNGQNASISKRNRTGYKGVSLCRLKRRYLYYRAVITINGRSTHLGLFKNPVDAARAYNEAALRCFGCFARLNEIHE